MKKIKKEYKMISPTDLTRADEHQKALPSNENEDCEGTIDSYKKYDRFHPVYFYVLLINGILVKKVIDGWKYVLFAIENKIDQIFACEITVDEPADVTEIMLLLQRSNHNSLLDLYNMIESLWPLYSKGQGYRSDLTDKELSVVISNPESEKPLNIYQQIGKLLCISGTQVKHIRKVGMVNMDYFERIESSRFSLYAAYLACKSEVEGVEPNVPSVKEPVYVSTATVTPVFSEQLSTSNQKVIPVYETALDENPSGSVLDQDVTATNAAPKPLTVTVMCTNCHESFELTIDKNNMK